MENQKYFLYLEPFVFLFVKNGKGLLYDTSCGKSFTFDVEGELLHIVAGLSEIENMYVLSIDGNYLIDNHVKQFVELIRANYLGDLVPALYSAFKPVLFPPMLDFQPEKSNDGEKSKKHDLLKNLNELTIYLSGNCKNKVCSQNCSLLCKQLLFCKREGDDKLLNLGDLRTYLSALPLSHFPIHIVGGNLSLYPYWDELMDLLTVHEGVDFLIHYTLFVSGIEKWSRVKCKILVDYPMSKDTLDECVTYVQRNRCDATFLFVVNDLNGFQQVLSFQEENKALEIEIKAAYDNNWDFFNDNVCFSIDDLQNVCLSKQEIFANQVLNTNDFGKLIIDSSGNIYTNLNECALGNIETETLKDSIQKALNGNGSWFRIRSMKPCSDCLYQWLCPSPSNYEYVVGRSDLCQIRREFE